MKVAVKRKWKKVVDFTKIKKGGVSLHKVLKKLRENKDNLQNWRE